MSINIRPYSEDLRWTQGESSKSVGEKVGIKQSREMSLIILGKDE